MDKNTTSKYRAIGILSVIICHAMGTFAQGRITWFTPLGGVGVAIFLLLSAYGLNESWNKLETGGGTLDTGGENGSSQYGYPISSSS